MRRSFDNRMAYGLFFEDGYRQRPEAESRPRLCSETVGGAIVGLMRWQVGEGRTERMLEVLPEAAYVALAPFIGPAAAIAFVEAKAAEAGAPVTSPGADARQGTTSNMNAAVLVRPRRADGLRAAQSGSDAPPVPIEAVVCT